MKYLKYFKQVSAYEAYKNGSDYVLPNVSYVLEGSKLFYNPYSNLKNGIIYATFNATSDNMTAIYDTSNVKSLIVDDKEISFDITEGSTIINIIGENITMNDDMQTGTFPEEYCYMLSNGLPSLWTFKPTNASMDECNYIALIGIVSGQMIISPVPINTGIEQGFFTYDDINNVFCVSESLLGQMSQEGIEGLNFACVKMDEVNGTFTFLDTTHDIKFRSGGKPIKYVFYNEGNHTMEIELIDDTIIPQAMFFGIDDYPRIGSCITSVTIPDSVTFIGDYTFKSCTSLSSVVIPDSVTSIGQAAFDDCPSLPVENNIRYADTYLVEAVDKSLSTYTIKEGTKWIENNAFYNCSNLTSVTIPDSVTSIGNGAFHNCTSLISINIPNSVIYIGNSAFISCTSLTTITIPDSVTSMGDNVFQDCPSLPVENNIRYADTYLVEVIDETQSTYTIKEGTKWIENYAFSYCENLTSIIIPDSVINIENTAFVNCPSLNEITCLAITAPRITYFTFNGIKQNGILKVPAGSDYSSWMSIDQYYLGYYNWTIEYI